MRKTTFCIGENKGADQLRGNLCNAKDSHILSTKNNNVFVIFMFEILMNRYLTMLLILKTGPWIIIKTLF